MKTPISYFLLALTVSLVATTWSVQGQVFDTDGDIIFNESYYVLPFVRGQGGGITLAGQAHDIPTCPTDIVQESSELEDGLPVKFSNWRPKVAFVPLNTDINIETEVGITICMRSAYWWVDMFTIEMKHMFLAVGPKPTSPKDSLSFFQIEEVGEKYIYKIKFCRGGSEGKPFCGYVGIILDKNGIRRLAITNGKAFLVQFKKANVNNVIESVLSKNM